MRKSIAALLAGATLAVTATPAVAQDGNSTRQVLGRILDVILGPGGSPQEQADSTDAAVPVVATTTYRPNS